MHSGTSTARITYGWYWASRTYAVIRGPTHIRGMSNHLADLAGKAQLCLPNALKVSRLLCGIRQRGAPPESSGR